MTGFLERLLVLMIRVYLTTLAVNALVPVAPWSTRALAGFALALAMGVK